MVDPAPSTEPAMSFLEHLDELRSRLFRVALVFVVVLAGCWFASDRILAFLLAPIRQHLFEGGEIIFIALTEPFMVSMKASALAALFVSAPYVLWQFWSFVAPGLYRTERRAGAVFIVAGTIFFVAGGAFGYYVALPVTVRWLIALGSQFKAQLTLQAAFDFESRMLLGAGLVFEMPIIILVLSRFGIVTPGFLLRHFKMAVMVIALAAALVTPSGDALTMAVFALPMIALYLLGVGFAWLAAKPASTKPQAP